MGMVARGGLWSVLTTSFRVPAEGIVLNPMLDIAPEQAIPDGEAATIRIRPENHAPPAPQRAPAVFPHPGRLSARPHPLPSSANPYWDNCDRDESNHATPELLRRPLSPRTHR